MNHVIKLKKLIIENKKLKCEIATLKKEKEQLSFSTIINDTLNEIVDELNFDEVCNFLSSAANKAGLTKDDINIEIKKYRKKQKDV